jgi:hypothetical protein
VIKHHLTHTLANSSLEVVSFLNHQVFSVVAIGNSHGSLGDDLITANLQWLNLKLCTTFWIIKAHSCSFFSHVVYAQEQLDKRIIKT